MKPFQRLQDRQTEQQHPGEEQQLQDWRLCGPAGDQGWPGRGRQGRVHQVPPAHVQALCRQPAVHGLGAGGLHQAGVQGGGRGARYRVRV